MRTTVQKTAVATLLAAATTLLSVTASAQEETIPPTGRSLFDFLVTKKVEGQPAVYDVPFPFEKLVEQLTLKAHGGQSSNTMTWPTMILVPNGRSLQKDFADLMEPRTIMAFTDHPSKTSDVGLVIRDRLFIAYASKSNQLEVMSYNELDGRFEFQVVSDYKQGGKREVHYASRTFCAECHQAGLPIFSKNTWDETNANTGVSEALLYAHDNEQTIHGIVKIKGNKGSAYSVDTSTDRAARLVSVMRLWRNGCMDVTGIPGLPEGFKPSDCRAHVFLFGLTSAAGLAAADLASSEGGYDFVSYDKIAEIWKKNLTEGDLKMLQGDLANRNPSGFQNSQLQLIAQERDRIDLWTKNLKENKTIDPAIEPKATKPTVHKFVPGVEPVVQALDMSVATISGMVTPSEIKAFPSDAAGFRTTIQGAFGKLLKEGAATEASTDIFAGRAFAKGKIMKQLLKTAGIAQLGGAAIASTCCESVVDLPPIKVSGGETFESNALALFGQFCGESCHAIYTEPAKLGFLAREQGMTDRQLFMKMVKLQKAEPCRRMDWGRPTAELALARRMPAAPHRQKFEAAEAQTGTSRRRDLIEAYKTELLSFAGDPAAQQEIGLTATELTAMAETCKWNGAPDSPLE